MGIAYVRIPTIIYRNESRIYQLISIPNSVFIASTARGKEKKADS